MKKRFVEIKFRDTHFDVVVDEDGVIDSIINQKENLMALFLCMGLFHDIITLTTEAIAEQDVEIAQQRKEINY
jgi:hypothetical protein